MPIKQRKNNMPVVQGRIGSQTVETLRDSGCNGVIIKRKFVNNSWLTGGYGSITMADQSKNRCN